MNKVACSSWAFAFLACCFCRPALAVPVEEALQSAVRVVGENGEALGVLTNKVDRLVVVDAAIVGDSKRVTVYFGKPGSRVIESGYVGKVVSVDEKHGVAVVQLNELPAEAKAIRVSPERVKQGQKVQLIEEAAGSENWRRAEVEIAEEAAVDGGPPPPSDYFNPQPNEAGIAMPELILNEESELVGIRSHPIANADPQILAVETSAVIQDTAAGYYNVNVLYGTDRMPRDKMSLVVTQFFWRFFVTVPGLVAVVAALVATVAAFIVAVWKVQRAWAYGLIAIPALLFVVVDLGWAYNQWSIANKKPGRFYTLERGYASCGECTVTIPKDHQMGRLESPQSLFFFELNEDVTKHFTVKDVKPAEGIQTLLAEKIKAADTDEVFVFVHGFNNTFEEAAKRTAQLCYDLQFKGVPLFYSWPSQGEPLLYTHDWNVVKSSTPYLTDFLRDVATTPGVKKVHIIAHSMGNQLVIDALAKLSDRGEYGKNSTFREIILAAPDVDTKVFEAAAPDIAADSHHITLYVSKNDDALKLSQKVSKYPRVGDANFGIVVVNQIETIDVSDLDTSIDNHSYYGAHKSVISDIHELLHSGKPAGERPRLKASKNKNDESYWIFTRLP